MSDFNKIGTINLVSVANKIDDWTFREMTFRWSTIDTF